MQRNFEYLRLRFPDKKRLRFFSIFVAVSFLFWIITKLSNTYSSLVEFDVNFVNVPPLIVLNENDHSVEALNRDEQAKEEIHISKNTLVKGMVVYCSDNNTSTYKTQIQIDDSAVVQGEVYCTKNLALQGSVFGSVYTHHFIVKKSGGVYVNHLYNAIINAKKLPIQYVGLLIENESNSVAKWLN